MFSSLRTMPPTFFSNALKTLTTAVLKGIQFFKRVKKPARTLQPMTNVDFCSASA